MPEKNCKNHKLGLREPYRLSFCYKLLKILVLEVSGKNFTERARCASVHLVHGEPSPRLGVPISKYTFGDAVSVMLIFRLSVREATEDAQIGNRMERGGRGGEETWGESAELRGLDPHVDA